MSYTDIIHRWLQAPSEIKEADYRLLKALKKQYPYFHPLYYLDQYLAGGKAARRSQPALLYPVNPVLLADWYASASVDSGDAAAAISGGTSADIEHASAIPETPELPATGTSLSGGDYFAAQGIRVDDQLPEDLMSSRQTGDIGKGENLQSPGKVIPPQQPNQTEEEIPLISQEKELMVVMSFSEWLNYLENRNQKAKEEEASQSAFKARWQQQKLAEALEEESDEIPETVFKMAVSSISRDEEPVSETLAEVYMRQGKKAKAIALFEKLSLQNPEKNAYFAQKIAQLKKEIDI